MKETAEHNLAVITIQYQDASGIEDLELQAALELLKGSCCYIPRE